MLSYHMQLYYLVSLLYAVFNEAMSLSGGEKHSLQEDGSAEAATDLTTTSSLVSCTLGKPDGNHSDGPGDHEDTIYEEVGKLSCADSGLQGSSFELKFAEELQLSKVGEKDGGRDDLRGGHRQERGNGGQENGAFSTFCDSKSVVWGFLLKGEKKCFPNEMCCFLKATSGTR